jgi:hypothetical protein
MLEARMGRRLMYEQGFKRVAAMKRRRPTLADARKIRPSANAYGKRCHAYILNLADTPSGTTVLR